VTRLIAQSIAFVYAPGDGLRVESDPLDRGATGARRRTVEGVVALEDAALQMPDGIVLRYGLLYGPGTWFERDKRGAPGLHVDAAAHAALLALTQAKRGIYNVAEDDGAISSEKAKRDFGFDAGFRLKPSSLGASERSERASKDERPGPSPFEARAARSLLRVTDWRIGLLKNRRVSSFHSATAVPPLCDADAWG
jgi:nucleoside-diphosphate-sugar epimerase